MCSAKTDEISFENALEKLENLVETIEKGDVPLSKLVEKFEEGSKLLNYCHNKLETAEQKIQQLKQTNGESLFATYNPENYQSDEKSVD